jgi:hypothetical protein
MIPEKVKDKLLDILDDFLNVRTLITLGAFFTVYVMTWLGKPVPDIIIRIVDLLLGFWFGEKVAMAIQNGKEQK